MGELPYPIQLPVPGEMLNNPEERKPEPRGHHDTNDAIDLVAGLQVIDSYPKEKRQSQESHHRLSCRVRHKRNRMP